MCPLPSSPQQVSAGSWLKFTLLPPAFFEWQLCRNRASDCGSCREIRPTPAHPRPPASPPLPKTQTFLIMLDRPPSTLNPGILSAGDEQSCLCVCLCLCVWHTVSSREVHFTRRLSVRNSLHCLLLEALIKTWSRVSQGNESVRSKLQKQKHYMQEIANHAIKSWHILHCMLNGRILTSVSLIGGCRCVMCQSGRPLIGASSISVRQRRDWAHRAPGDSVQILPPGTLFLEGLAKKPNEPFL